MGTLKLNAVNIHRHSKTACVVQSSQKMLNQSLYVISPSKPSFLPLKPSAFPIRPYQRTITRCSSTLPSSSPPQITFYSLPDGMRIEVIQAQQPVIPQQHDAPILLFIHGSYHAAWCWAENYLPFFSSRGFEAMAISLRGQGNSDRGDLKIAGTLQSHADDLASIIASLPRPPIVIGHSFGGLLVEKYASQLSNSNDTNTRPPIAGLALLCAVPPSGNKDIVVRITKKSIADSFKITWAFVTKSFARDLDACRETFFSPDIPLEKLKKYQKLLAECSSVRLLDLSSLNKELPLEPLSESLRKSLPVFVGGGLRDLVVDVPAIEETAAYFGVKPVFWDDMAHDCMLDTRWEESAESLYRWLIEEVIKDIN